MNIDVNKIEPAIKPKTKAIIEDACQAHGALYRDRKTGLWGDCAAFSLNQNKCLCGGEGGLFVTNNEEILESAKMLWSFGETRTPSEDRDYHVYAMGWMYRNSDLNAAFARAQLSKLDRYLAEGKENALYMHEKLKGIPGLILPEVPDECEHNWYNYVIRFDMQKLGHTERPREFRDALIKAMKAEGVETMVWQRFILPAMTVFQAKNGYGKGCTWDCPHSEHVDYSLYQYPEAQRHCDTHTCFVMALRSPNGTEVAGLMAEGVRKVMENADQIEI